MCYVQFQKLCEEVLASKNECKHVVCYGKMMFSGKSQINWDIGNGFFL